MHSELPSILAIGCYSAARSSLKLPYWYLKVHEYFNSSKHDLKILIRKIIEIKKNPYNNEASIEMNASTSAVAEISSLDIDSNMNHTHEMVKNDVEK